MDILYVCSDIINLGRQQPRAIALSRKFADRGHDVTICSPDLHRPLREPWPTKAGSITTTAYGHDSNALVPLLRRRDLIVMDGKPIPVGIQQWPAIMRSAKAYWVWVNRPDPREGSIDQARRLTRYDLEINSDAGPLMLDADELIPRDEARQTLGLDERPAVLVGEGSTPLPYPPNGLLQFVHSPDRWPMLEYLEAFDAAITTGSVMLPEIRGSGLPFCAVAMNEYQDRVIETTCPQARTDPAEFLASVQPRIEPLDYVNPAEVMVDQILDHWRLGSGRD